ncbi:MAG: L,D-transpeptidase family protein [Phycisphaerales bacterium]
MPLPSQNTRPSGSMPSSMSRARKPNLKPVAIGVGTVALVAVAIWALTKIGGGDEASLGPKSATAANPVTPQNQKPSIAAIKPGPGDTGAAPAPGPVATKPPDPPPLELRQGRHNPPPATTTIPPVTAPPAGAANPPKAPAAAHPPAGAAPVIPSPSESITSGLPADLQGYLSSGFQKLAAGDPVGARASLSRALLDDRLPENDKTPVRAELTRLNDDLVFSPRIAQGDPHVLAYFVQSNDSLVRINQKNNLGPDWRLIQRINRMSDPNRLGLNQRLKLIKGPFHAVVHKATYRLDVWMGAGPDPTQWVYVRSFPVGLGESGTTPDGDFVVKKGSKLKDPPWVNPRTGERFVGGAANNPIGKFWVGLEGTGDAITNVGYGLHGTIDPGSIGQQKSMGCIRLHADDIALMFELMGEQVSTVRIMP